MISYDNVALRFLFRVEAGRRFKFQRWWCVGVERHLTATLTRRRRQRFREVAIPRYERMDIGIDRNCRRYEGCDMGMWERV
jgi:hypothetical protein